MLLGAIAGLITWWSLSGTDGHWWAAIVGQAVLFSVLLHTRLRWALPTGLAFGMALFGPHVWWAKMALNAYLPWFALVLTLSLYVGAFAWGYVAIQNYAWARRLLPQIVLYTVGWASFEQLRCSWPFGGFAWVQLAFSQTAGPWQSLIPWIGQMGINILIPLAGASLVAAVKLRSIGRVVAGLVLVVAVLAPALAPFPRLAQTGTLSVGAVQGNVAKPGLDAFSHRLEVTTNHADGTKRLMKKVGSKFVDLVLWPENAADVDPREDPEFAAVVDNAAQVAKAPVLVGAVRYEGPARYNDVIVWRPGTGPAAVYTKQHPVPFAEYIPFKSLARKLSSAADLIGTDMRAGTKPADLPVYVERMGRDVKLATAICFEVAYDDILREGVKRGGEILYIPTNNATFGRSAESEQQLQMTKFRALETGRSAVQISTVGVSGIVNNHGTVLQRLELFTAGEMQADLPLYQGVTPALRLAPALHGLLWLLGGAYLALAIGAIARRKGAERKKLS